MITADLDDWLSVIPNTHVCRWELTVNVLLDAWSYDDYACATTRDVDMQRSKWHHIPSIYGANHE